MSIVPTHNPDPYSLRLDSDPNVDVFGNKIDPNTQESQLTDAQLRQLDELDVAVASLELRQYFGGGNFEQSYFGDCGKASQDNAHHLLARMNAGVNVGVVAEELRQYYQPGPDRSETFAATQHPEQYEQALQADKQMCRDPSDWDSAVRALECQETFRSSHAHHLEREKTRVGSAQPAETPDQIDERKETAWQHQGMKEGMPTPDKESMGAGEVDDAAMSTFLNAFDREKSKRQG